MNRKNNAVVGIIFIILGVLFLLKNFNVFNIYFDIFDIGNIISIFWPFFIIIPGLAFHSIYFTGKNKDAGVLVPGGILLITGITCQLSVFFNIWDIMWPGFIMAVAVGLFELFLFGGREKGLLIPVCILGGISSILIFQFSIHYSVRNYLIPIILIIIGITVFFRNRPEKKKY
jgi:hypothetical protein